jgi:hypothetical protein
MRILNEHKVNPVNDQLIVKTIDEPGSGGAHHAYVIAGEHGYSANFSAPDPDNYGPDDTVIVFQNGPINEAGVNGITHEALLVVVLDRLRSFQNGPYKCKANACAITHIEEAMHWLQQRTLERMHRGVEGSNKV